MLFRDNGKINFEFKSFKKFYFEIDLKKIRIKSSKKSDLFEIQKKNRIY